MGWAPTGSKGTSQWNQGRMTSILGNVHHAMQKLCNCLSAEKIDAAFPNAHLAPNMQQLPLVLCQGGEAAAL